MRHKLVSLDSCMGGKFFEASMSSGQDNRKSIAKMKNLLCKAINLNLTQRQRECVMLYYMENKKISEVAAELNIDKSTVSRHLSSARKKLKSLNALI